MYAIFSNICCDIITLKFLLTLEESTHMLSIFIGNVFEIEPLYLAGTCWVPGS